MAYDFVNERLKSEMQRRGGGGGGGGGQASFASSRRNGMPAELDLTDLDYFVEGVIIKEQHNRAEFSKAEGAFRQRLKVKYKMEPHSSGRKTMIEENKPSVEDEGDIDPYANDPFFKKIFDGQWNACIGRQGHEENYIDGYIEAAIELSDAIFEKQLFGKRDTLVLPILYNARHAIELALKFTTERLTKASVIKSDGRKLSHNIKGYWDHLRSSSIGDEKLSQTIVNLKPFIESVSQIDSDGQELRYHRNRNDDSSLAEHAVANLRLIRDSLRELEKLISALKYRTMDFINERATGSYTSHCSRSDLLAIARILPRREAWSSEVFDQQKVVVKERYGLGNRQFAFALDCIQKNREMRSILGMDSNLLHLTDDDIISVIEQWRRLHPVRELEKDDHGLDFFDITRFEAKAETVANRREVLAMIEARLSTEALADLEVMFYLGRDRVFAEYYESMVARVLKEHVAAKDPQVEILHLMEKTNFLQSMQGATTRLGRLALAERLKTM